jgi:hypothetical protein
LSFVAFALYIHYNPNPIVISHSTQNAAVISQGFTALFALWHFFALIPALSVVSSVRSEEWWRRLLHSTTFNRANSVSSNISGNVAHLVEMVISWSSPYYKIAWIVAIFAVILSDIAPGAIHAETGMNAIDNSFAVPAFPPNSRITIDQLYSLLDSTEKNDQNAIRFREANPAIKAPGGQGTSYWSAKAWNHSAHNGQNGVYGVERST